MPSIARSINPLPVTFPPFPDRDENALRLAIRRRANSVQLDFPSPAGLWRIVTWFIEIREHEIPSASRNLRRRVEPCRCRTRSSSDAALLKTLGWTIFRRRSSTKTTRKAPLPRSRSRKRPQALRGFSLSESLSRCVLCDFPVFTFPHSDYQLALVSACAPSPFSSPRSSSREARIRDRRD